MKYLFRFTFYLCLAACIAELVSSCSMLGIATEGYVESRVDAVKANTTDCAVAVAQPIDAVVPGYASFVRSSYMGKPVAPPPPPPAGFPWTEVLAIVGAAAGVSVPTAVKVTNAIRDNNRMKRGEALTVDQAVAKGYFEDSATKA